MPATTDTGRACQQIAFDHEKSFDHHIALPVIAGILTARPLIMPYRAAWTYTAATIEPSPPDLQVLHSTFLI